MIDEREIAELKAEVAHLKSWRHRLLDALPLAVFTALVVGSLYLQINFSGRLGLIEERTAQIDARLGRVETRLEGMEGRLDRMNAALVEIARSLGRLEKQAP